MKRLWICMALVLVMLPCLVSCGGSDYEEYVLDEVFMPKTAKELADDICLLAKDGNLSELMNLPAECVDYVKTIGKCGAGDPYEAYLLGGAPNFKRLMRTFGDSDEVSDLDTEVIELLEKRFNWPVLLTSSINASYGSSFLAAASYLSVNESYRVKEIGEESYLLVLYGRGRFGIAVAFNRSGEGIVQVQATPIGYDGVLERMEEYAAHLHIDFTEIDLDDFES